MRTIIRNAIINDATLTGYGVTPEGTLSGDVDTPATRPFVNLKWGTDLPSFRGSLTVQTNLAIWVHDNPGDYTRISQILTRLSVLLPSLVAVKLDSSEVQVADFMGNGPDVQDDGHRTIVKVGNYRVVGKA